MRRRRTGVVRPPWAGPLGLYHPGTSAVHRASPGLKLALLFVAGVTVVVLRGPRSAVVATVLAVLLALVARVPWRRTSRGVLPVLVTAAVVGLYQGWARGPALGIEVALDLVSLVLGATLVTATTRADLLLDVITRVAGPLRHVGLRAETLALAVGLMLRAIPVLVSSTAQARDAARARGLSRHPRALLVPAAVRMVGHAQRTGEALAARGLGEDPSTSSGAADA